MIAKMDDDPPDVAPAGSHDAPQPRSEALAPVAAELYGLGLAEFTAERDARARQARESGDRELAAQIKALRRPTLAAWLANQLVRAHPEDVGPLLALGAALRAATEQLDGQELRDLSVQQRRVVAALVAQARALAHAAGQRVSVDAERGLEDTLLAVLADPAAADAFAAGQLTAGVSPSGFPGTVAPEPRDGARPPGRGPRPHPGARVAAAQSDVDAAAAANAEAQVVLAGAVEAATRAAADADMAAARVTQLRVQLEESMRARAEADRIEGRARAARVDAERRALVAQQALADARQRVRAALEASHGGCTGREIRR